MLGPSLVTEAALVEEDEEGNVAQTDAYPSDVLLTDVLDTIFCCHENDPADGGFAHH